MSIKLTKIKKLPDAPGVYFFLGKNRKILYIGKATSLKDRVRSYFAKDIEIVRSPLIAQMIESAVSIDFKQTDSVLEALILEADLIKKFKPEFNTKEKDDKSFYCVAITNEDFPIIKLVRKKDVKDADFKYVFGPYPESNSIKEALKIIRKIFPYRDEKCLGVDAKRPCFNYTIGLCPGVCAGVINKKEYSKIIRNISLFFQGKKKKLLQALNKEMLAFAKLEKFEEAQKIRNQIYALEHIRDISLIKNNSLENDSGFRIESYDIAHTMGSDMVGAMVVMVGGELDKNEYRIFNIKSQDRSNDIGALKEVLERRLSHTEWRLPDLVVMDGGIAQLNIAESFFNTKNIPVVAVTKDERHKAKSIIGESKIVEKYKREILTVNAETHRFAITRHRQKRGKSFIKQA